MSHFLLSASVVSVCVAPAFGVEQLQTQQMTKQLIARYAPKYAAQFVLEAIPAENGCDAYEVESKGNRIILRGNSGVALSSAFAHYLKEFCHCQMSWNGDQLNLPKVLPVVASKVRVVSPVKHRMAYNYCTHGYTMAFWDEAEWAREIDWLAMHGVNQLLIIQGQDAVWQNTFEKFGYSREEMRQWLTSPAHQAWQFMGNMEHCMPAPQSVIDRRVKLGQFIIKRAKQFGMKPILQGYYGMLPSNFAKKHPKAQIVPQGAWAANLKRPDMLHTSDPLYSKIAKTFMEEQKKLFGDVEFLAADPFHEGGQTGSMQRSTVYKQIQDEMLAFDPKITFVKQCWQTSNNEMFNAGDKEHSLALDLWSDTRPFWRNANSYDGTPWMWCFLYNFGGNLALEGNPVAIAKNFSDTFKDPNRKRLEGVGLVPEGSQTNPMMYELVTEMAWRGGVADVPSWVNHYLHARYGVVEPHAEEAWKMILETAYSVSPTHESPINSVIAARPSLDRNLRGRKYCPGSTVPYDNTKLFAAWEKLHAAAPKLRDRATYRYDLADCARQVLCNLARPVYEKAAEAIEKKDGKALEQHSKVFLALLKDLDDLTGTQQNWLMGAWVADAQKMMGTSEDKKYMAKIARMLLTTWTPNAGTDLSDYANREWNGLLEQFYAVRWRLFFEQAAKDVAANRAFNQGELDKVRNAFDEKWVNEGAGEMKTKPVGDSVVGSEVLLKKYAPLMKVYYK